MGDWSDYANYLTQDSACADGYLLGNTDGAVWAATNGVTALGNYEFDTENDKGEPIKINVNETEAILAGKVFIVAMSNNDKA